MKSLKILVGQFCGVGCKSRHTIFLRLKNGTLQNNEPYQRNVVHVPYLEYVATLDSYS